MSRLRLPLAFCEANGDVFPFKNRQYQMPHHYHGPMVTLLPDSGVNSTHVKATFRCQVSTTYISPYQNVPKIGGYIKNCTTWRGGSLGSGNLNSVQNMAYATSTKTAVQNPSDVDSEIHYHNDYGYFKLDLSGARLKNYDHYLSFLDQPATYTGPRLP